VPPFLLDEVAHDVVNRLAQHFLLAQDALDRPRDQAKAFGAVPVLGFEIADARSRRGVAGLELGKEYLLLRMMAEVRIVSKIVDDRLHDFVIRCSARNKSDHLLTGLLFDDAGHRMIPTHATKAGVRYRYYVSTPCLHGEAKTAPAGSVSRVPAADIEDVIVKSLNEHLAANQGTSTTSALRVGDRGTLAELVAGIVAHRGRLIVRLKSDSADEASDCPDDRSLSIPWQKPHAKRSRQILLPHNASRSDVRPEQFERRARLISAIARGRRRLNDVVSGRVTTVAELALARNAALGRSI